MNPWLAQNSQCRQSWPEFIKDLHGFVSSVLGGVCYHTQQNTLMSFILISFKDVLFFKYVCICRYMPTSAGTCSQRSGISLELESQAGVECPRWMLRIELGRTVPAQSGRSAVQEGNRITKGRSQMGSWQVCIALQVVCVQLELLEYLVRTAEAARARNMSCNQSSTRKAEAKRKN